MAVAFVQVAGNNTLTPVTSLSAAYGSANSAGNLLIAAVSWGGAGTCTVTDSAGNTWAAAGTYHDATNDQSLGIFYAKNSAAGANTVTASFGASTNYIWIAAHEYSGLDTTAPLDQHPAFTNTSATNATDNAASSSCTPTTNGQLIFGACMEDGNGTSTPTAGTGYNQRIVQFHSLSTEDKVQATAAAVTATWTMSASTPSYMAGIVTFKAAGGGGDATSTATSGAHTLTGLRAASTAGILAAAALAGLAWSGMPASSGATRTDTATASSTAWQGLTATSTSDIVHTTSSPGSITLAGAAPSLLFEDVVTGTGPAAASWDGITATSLTDTLASTEPAAAAWSGLPATSSAAAAGADLATAGTLTWSGHAATSTTGVVDTTDPAAATWSGTPAASSNGIVSDAQASTSSWSGLSATSTSSTATDTSQGSLSLAGLTAVSVTGTTSPTDVPTLAWSGLQASSFAVDPDVVAPPQRTLTIPAEDRTLVIAAEDRTLTIT